MSHNDSLRVKSDLWDEQDFEVEVEGDLKKIERVVLFYSAVQTHKKYMKYGKTKTKYN